MLRPLLALSVLASAPEVRPLPERDLGAALAELTSPSADARRRAERWIATRATRDDYPLLAEALEEGDEELRTRVVRALGSEDENLGLAVLLAGELRPALRTAGRAALEEMLLRWSERLDDPPLVRGALRARLLELHDEYRPRILQLDLADPLTVAVDRIARSGDVPVPLVVDPVVADLGAPEIGPRGVAIARGVWDQMLVFLAERDGLGLEGYGLETDGAGFARGFLRVCRLRDEGRREGTDLVLEWLHDAAHGDLPVRRASAARALAATGWPAATAWLAERWARSADPVALEGVLVALARGDVPAVAATPDSVARILARGLSDLAASEEQGATPHLASRRRAWLALDALGALPPLGAGGASLVEPIVSGWEDASPRERWYRLAALEGMAPRSSEVRSLTEPILTDPTQPALLRLQALRTRVAARRSSADDVGPIAVAAPEDLLPLAPELPEDARALAHLLLEAGVDPDPARLPEGSWEEPAQVAALAEWSLGRGRPELAAETLGRAGWAESAPGDPDWDGSVPQRLQRRTAAFLRDRLFRAERDVAESLVAELEARSSGPAADAARRRVAALAGLLPEDALPAPAEVARDPELLGALAAGPGGEAARASLLELVRGTLAEGADAGADRDPRAAATLREGLERAVEELLLAHEDREADTFLRELRALASESPETPRRPFREHLLQADWPPAPRVTPRRLGASDPRLAPGLLD